MLDHKYSIHFPTVFYHHLFCTKGGLRPTPIIPNHHRAKARYTQDKSPVHEQYVRPRYLQSARTSTIWACLMANVHILINIQHFIHELWPADD